MPVTPPRTFSHRTYFYRQFYASPDGLEYIFLHNNLSCHLGLCLSFANGIFSHALNPADCLYRSRNPCLGMFVGTQQHDTLVRFKG